MTNARDARSPNPVRWPSRVDVVIVNWNTGTRLRDCVDSVLEHGGGLVRDIIVAHHEYKPKGYPRTGIDRRGDQRATPNRRTSLDMQQQGAQLVAAADMYDAFTTRRAYKAGAPSNTLATLLANQFRGDQRYIEQLLKRHVDPPEHL